MNLLRNIDMGDKEQKEKDIAHIFDELERTDCPELKKKIDLIKAFIGDVIPKMKENDSVDEAFADYEAKKRTEEIENFATINSLDLDKLKNAISEYEFSGIANEAKISEELCSHLGFKAKRMMRQTIIMFITENCMKYGN